MYADEGEEAGDGEGEGDNEDRRSNVRYDGSKSDLYMGDVVEG